MLCMQREDSEALLPCSHALSFAISGFMVLQVVPCKRKYARKRTQAGEGEGGTARWLKQQRLLAAQSSA